MCKTANNVAVGSKQTRRQKADFYVTEGGTVLLGKEVRLDSQYDKLAIERKSGRSVRPKDAINDWDNFLGPD